jgi:chemotaxis signal transduction protein
MGPGTAQTGGEPHYLLLRSGGHRCAIPVASTQQVIRSLEVHPLPGSEPRLVGLAQAAGEPIAVVDLHALLDPDGNVGSGRELTVVVRRSGRHAWIGLAADEAFGVIQIRAADDPAPDDPSWVVGRRLIDKRPTLILDPDRLFDVTEHH